MIRFASMLAVFCVSTLILAASATCAFGLSFTAGNVLVSAHDTVTEYTLAGAVVQTIDVDAPTGGDVLVRDAVVDQFGRLHVMTFPQDNMAISQAYLSTYDPLQPLGSQWQHNTIAGWSLGGVAYYGGITINENYVFAPDIATSGGGNRGIIRFPLNDLASPQRFHDVSANSFHAVKLGLDGFLYGLEAGPGILPANPNLVRFDPNSPTLDQDLGFAMDVDVLGSSVMSVAVDASGEIYTVDLKGDVHHFDSSGVLQSTTVNATGGTDMELLPDGTLIFGSPGIEIDFLNDVNKFGESVSITNIPGLDPIAQFSVPVQNDGHVNFVAFTSVVPEPSTSALCAAALVLLVAAGIVRWRLIAAKH